MKAQYNRIFTRCRNKIIYVRYTPTRLLLSGAIHGDFLEYDARRELICTLEQVDGRYCFSLFRLGYETNWKFQKLVGVVSSSLRAKIDLPKVFCFTFDENLVFVQQNGETVYKIFFDQNFKVLRRSKSRLADGREINPEVNYCVNKGEEMMILIDSKGFVCLV